MYNLTKTFAGLALPFLLILPAQAAGRHTVDTHVPEKAVHAPMLQRLPATQRLELAIGLPLRNLNTLSNLVGQIYDRRSANFHRYLTPEQFAEQFGPEEQDYQNVINYAKSHGLMVTRTFGNRAVVVVEGQVSDIEKTFQVHLGLFQHPTENRTFFAPDGPPTVDASLNIITVSGLDSYFIPHSDSQAIPINENQIRARTKDSLPGGGSFVIIPDGGSFTNGTNALYGKTDFRNAYAPGTDLNGSGQVVGLYEGASYNTSDINKYETMNGLPNASLDNIVLEPVNLGGNFEVSLDIEMVIAMAPDVSQVNVYEGTNADVIITEMATPTQGEPMPNQISSSWGIIGDSIIQQDLIEIAAQGQAYFTASGDYGAFIGPDGQESQYFSSYMTYVGGTQLFMNGAGESWSNEIVWHDTPGTNFNYFASTGGVLTDLSIPIYQKGLSMTLNQGSTKYRNFPDVAMVARDILNVSTVIPTNGSPNKPGQVFIALGTSASSPLWAGFAALVNQQAANQGLPSVGFLNPALYEIGEGQLYEARFHDITNGDNAWSDPYNGTSSEGLYDAVPGYDLCTGWGSPAGLNLINALVGYAGAIFVDFGYTGSIQNGSYFEPFSTLAEGISAVYSGGTIVIKNGGSSSAAVTITKPMTITAIGGAATIGN
jgi:subtilase family serine protease